MKPIDQYTLKELEELASGMRDFERKWYQSNKELAELNAHLKAAVTALEKTDQENNMLWKLIENIVKEQPIHSFENNVEAARAYYKALPVVIGNSAATKALAQIKGTK